MKSLTSMEAYQEQIKHGKTILLFTADWCRDCVFIKPFMPEIEEKFTTYQFLSVDRDEMIDLCSDLAIFGIPSFVAFEAGEEIGRFVSKDRKTQEEIEQFIASLPVK
ncbi:thioredoxin family protein [Isobaculum melis]|uniref:Thioredoxin n=1 Tax=Isobaculum melis TaxID=142588 RepID=A0A1H9S7E9_9LACT|nr:thioredoxin family protein [Isobaculum melis]SER80952.1 Thioredoxin [Isobaculum melis]